MGELGRQFVIAWAWSKRVSGCFVGECWSRLVPYYTAIGLSHQVDLLFFFVVPHWGSFCWFSAILLWLIANLFDLLIMDPAKTADLNLDIKFLPTSLELLPS